MVWIINGKVGIWKPTRMGPGLGICYATLQFTPASTWQRTYLPIQLYIEILNILVSNTINNQFILYIYPYSTQLISFSIAIAYV